MACSNLSPNSQKNCIGDFDHGSPGAHDLPSPVFDHQDFALLFTPSQNLDTFTLQSLLDLVSRKYHTLEAQRQVELATLFLSLVDGERAAFIKFDPLLVRTQKITAFLRKLGTPGSTPPSIIINPFNWLNSDLLGAGGRFSWADFAVWVNTFLSHGTQTQHFAQVILFRPLDLWSGVSDLAAHAVTHDFGRSHLFTQHLRGTLVGSDPVNFGSFSSLPPTPGIVYKFANGLHKVTFYSFATPLRFAETPFSSTLGNQVFAELSLFDSEAFDSENASASALRDFPLPIDNSNSLIVMFPTSRILSRDHLVIITAFRARTSRFSQPWSAPPLWSLGLLHSRTISGP
jgi:hypothetical protein